MRCGIFAFIYKVYISLKITDVFYFDLNLVINLEQRLIFPYPLSKTLSSSPSRAPKPCPELAPKRLHHYCFFFFSDSILSRLTNPSSPNQFFFFFFFDDYIAFLYRFFMSHHCHSLLVLPLSVLYLRYTPFPSLCVFSVLIFILDFGIEIVVFCKIIPLNFGPFMPDLSD